MENKTVIIHYLKQFCMY